MCSTFKLAQPVLRACVQILCAEIFPEALRLLSSSVCPPSLALASLLIVGAAKCKLLMLAVFMCMPSSALCEISAD